MNNANLIHERTILSGICRHGSDAFLDVADIIKADTFTYNTNIVIYKCLEQIFESDINASIDSSSILIASNNLGLSSIFEAPSEVSHLRAILTTPIEISTVRRSAAVIRKLEIAREMRQVVDKIDVDLSTINGTESMSEILCLAEQPLFDFVSNISSNSDGNETVKIGDKFEEYLKFVEENPDQAVGISTGMGLYDECIGGGLRRSTVTTIGARAKTGKTFLSDNIGLHISRELGIPVLNLDTEMSSDERIPRMNSILTGIPTREIETAEFVKQPHKKEQLYSIAKEMTDVPYYYRNICGQPFEETIAAMRRWVKRDVGEEGGVTKNCVIILDYLKVMDSNSISPTLAEWQLLGFMMSALQSFANRYQVPIVCMLQLNRDGIDAENETAAAGSDRIVWFCSSFSIFKNKTAEEMAESGGPTRGNKKLIPIVSRHGTGLDHGDYINLVMHDKTGKITEGKTRNFTGRTDDTEGSSDEISFT